jgi:hypothetical protein
MPEPSAEFPTTIRNMFGDPLGTTYYATPEDWAIWQDLQKKPVMEVWTEREALKNKYGGNVPKPPKETAKGSDTGELDAVAISDSGATVPSLEKQAKQLQIRELLQSAQTPHAALKSLVDAGFFTGLKKELAQKLVDVGDVGQKLSLGGELYSRQWGKHAAGKYDRLSDTIHVYDKAFEHNKGAYTFLHEYVHSLTVNAIREGKFKSELEQLFDHASIKAAREGRQFHGVSQTAKQIGGDYSAHLHEFVAEAMSNPKFQEFLKTQRSPIRGQLTLWQEFVNWISKVFEIKPSSSLADALRISLELSESRKTKGGEPEQSSSTIDLGEGVTATIYPYGDIHYNKGGSRVGQLKTSQTPEGDILVESHQLDESVRGSGLGGKAIAELSRTTGKRIISDSNPSKAASEMWARIGAKQKRVTLGEGEFAETSIRYVLEPKEKQKGGDVLEKAKEEKPVLEPEKTPGFVQWEVMQGPGGEWFVSNGKKSLRATGGEEQAQKTSKALNSKKVQVDKFGNMFEPADIISKLEDLKFKPKGGTGELHALRPDILQRVGRQIWNDAIDLAIFTIRAGKTVAEAIDAALAHIRKTRTGIDEAPLRQELERILAPETPEEAPAIRPAAATPPPIPEATREVVDPVTGEPAKMITEAAAKAMERKVKIPAQTDVKKLTEQINLFNREIGDALESGGRFLPKEMRPDVAKGAPAEKGTVTNKEINQYFVNKLSSIRKDMQATSNRIKQQADIESQVYFDLLQKRFEQAFRQVQELRRTSHEALYFWNRIRAEYQAIAQAAGAMPEMKRQLPVIDQIWKDMREQKYQQAGRHFVDYLRMNLFTLGSWTLDFGTNLVATTAKLPAWAIMDMGSLVSGRPASRMFTAMRALADNTRNWNPLGKRFRLPDRIESELGTTAGGEFGGKGREVLVDFSEILKDRPELADKLRHIDKLIGAPIRMKRAVDGFFGRFGATAELYNRAYIEGKSRGLKGDELKQFTEEFVQNPPEAAIQRALKTGKELKFNRDLSKFEESFANNLAIKIFVEAFPRWTLQFMRWTGEMTGVDPVFFKKLATGKVTPEDAVNYFTKAATGWGGIYAFNQLFYDNIDANSMEYVKEDGNRVRLAGRTPAPELFFVSALLRGDTEKAKAALAHLSLPGAKLLSGEPAGLISPLVDTIRESIRGRYTVEQTARELTKLVNDAIPGKSVLGLIRAVFDPTIREGIGAPIPGVSALLPQRVNPTTGEPLAPKQRIPGTKIEIPTVAGTPFPGAERVLNDVESALLDHGLGTTRPRRTSIIDLPAEDVPKTVRKEYEQMVGRNIKELIGEEIKSPDFWKEEFEWRREILSRLMTEARSMARDDLADKYGTSGEPIKSVPLNIQRLPERMRK